MKTFSTFVVYPLSIRSTFALPVCIYTHTHSFPRSTIIINRRILVTKKDGGIYEQNPRSRSCPAMRVHACTAILHAGLACSSMRSERGRYHRERRRRRRRRWWWLGPRTPGPHTGVNYASREMSNCSPYRKIYNSSRCGKHYVPSPTPVRPYPFPSPDPSPNRLVPRPLSPLSRPRDHPPFVALTSCSPRIAGGAISSSLFSIHSKLFPGGEKLRFARV